MKIAVTGSIAYDILTQYKGKLSDRMPQDNSQTVSVSLLVEDQKKHFGGTGINISYTLKLLGQDPIIVGSVGSDFGVYEEYLNKLKISTSKLTHVDKYYTSAYYAASDKNGGQIGIFYAGAMLNNKNINISNIVSPVDLVIIAANDPEATKNYVKQSIKNKNKYIYNPGFNTMLLNESDLLEGCLNSEVLIANDAEFDVICNKTNLSLEEICKKVPIVIETIGSRGSIYFHKGKSVSVGVAKIKKFVDPSGAGDSYIAGFTAGYINGNDLNTSCQIGALCASYTVEKNGTQLHEFSLKEFKERYYENFKSHISNF